MKHARWKKCTTETTTMQETQSLCFFTSHLFSTQPLISLLYLHCSDASMRKTLSSPGQQCGVQKPEAAVTKLALNYI